MKPLRIEWLKLGRTSTYILFGLMLFFAAAFTVLMVYMVHKNMDKGYIPIIARSEHSMLTFLLVIYLCINIGREYSENTLRRSIIEGYTRHQYYMGKLLLVLLCALFVTALLLISVAIAGVISGHFEMMKGIFSPVSIINFFAGFFAAGVFAFFLSFLTRNIAISIVLYFLWGLLESLVSAFQQMAGSKAVSDIDFYHFLPRASVDKVLNANETVAVYFVFVAVFYLLLMMIIPYLLFVNRDIK